MWRSIYCADCRYLPVRVHDAGQCAVVEERKEDKLSYNAWRDEQKVGKDGRMAPYAMHVCKVGVGSWLSGSWDVWGRREGIEDHPILSKACK